MDELELLKRDWQRQEKSYPKVKASDIYGMIHKKSSSLTKWILIIAILEFAFWITLTVVFSGDDQVEKLRTLHFYKANIVINIIHYTILAAFIVWFYLNYKKVKVTDSTRGLMSNILKVRRTVNIYVLYNIISAGLIMIAVLAASVMYDPTIKSVFEDNNGENSVKIIIVFTVFVVVALAIFWLFYRLLYGILLRRLYRNYKELNKLELQ